VRRGRDIFFRGGEGDGGGQPRGYRLYKKKSRSERRARPHICGWLGEISKGGEGGGVRV